MPDVERRHRDVFRKAAIAIDTDDPRVRADVRVPGAAGQASAADDMSFSSHAITHLHVRDELAGFDHIARELMSDDERWLASTPSPVVPLVDVHVGTADTGPTNPDQDLIVANGRNRNVGQLKARTGVMLYE